MGAHAKSNENQKNFKGKSYKLKENYRKTLKITKHYGQKIKTKRDVKASK